jgi:predicted ATPase
LFDESEMQGFEHTIESQSRFNYSIIQFIKLIASKETPVVLFLDDVQWSDLASLDLLKDILTDISIQYLTIIISYRDNEVLGDHPLSVTLNEVREYNTQVRQARLKGFDCWRYCTITRETLSINLPAELGGLADIIFTKTEGNPFFINEFLKTLYAHDIIRWNAPAHKWEWVEERISEMSVTDNVVHFLSQKIKGFPCRCIEDAAMCFLYRTKIFYSQPRRG